MPNPKESGLSDNSIAALAYFTPFPAIFFLAIRRYNKRPYVRFHSWQSLVFGAFVFLFSSTSRTLSWDSACSSNIVPPGTVVAGRAYLGRHLPGVALVCCSRLEWQAVQAPDHRTLGRRAGLQVTRPSAVLPKNLFVLILTS